MKAILIILMLLPLCAFAQKKWHAITDNDCSMMIGQALAGAADAVNQDIQFGKIGSGRFWDYKVSWKNKYRDYDGGDLRAAFPMSKTALVSFTDGYHLTRTMNHAFVLASFAVGFGDLCEFNARDRWKVIAKKIILSIIANRLSFNIIYK